MERRFEFCQAILITVITAISAYLDSTLMYLCALLIAFAFNIVAGFRADEVQVKIQRFFPPIFFKNFQGNKFKDSLMELFLITFIIYFMKSIAQLLKYEVESVYIVRYLVAIACYFYFRNALKNLHLVYPKSKFISFIYFLLAFKLRELFGSDVADMVDKAEKEEK